MNRSSSERAPSRMVTTSLTDLATMLPPDLSERPRFGADERPAIPHIVLITDGAELPPGNHVIPPDGLHGLTMIDLPTRWTELDDPGIVAHVARTVAHHGGNITDMNTRVIGSGNRRLRMLSKSASKYANCTSRG